MKTAQQAAANWSASSGRATTAYTDGVRSTQKDQAGLAVQAEARLLQGFNDAVSSGRWRSGVMRGGTAYWKAQSEKKAANYGVGFAAGADNFQQSIAKVMNAIGGIVPSLPPRGDVNQNIQRSAAFALALHSLKGQLGAR